MSLSESPEVAELFDASDWERILALQDELVVSYQGILHRVSVRLDPFADSSLLIFMVTPLPPTNEVHCIYFNLFGGRLISDSKVNSPLIGNELDVSYVRAFLQGYVSGLN